MLWNNAGMGEAGPVWEIPIDLVRKNYEVNVFLPLVLTQGVVRSWVAEGKKGKVVFTSSMGGLFTPANWGTYVSTKHALESIAEALQQELAPYGIKVQTINPGAYYTGYNETMADNPFRWLDDTKHFTKRADLRKGFDDFFATPEGRMDPQEMIDRMIEIVPADTGKFRNVVPKAIEDMLKDHQHARGKTRSDLVCGGAVSAAGIAVIRQSSRRSSEGDEMSTKIQTDETQNHRRCMASPCRLAPRELTTAGADRRRSERRNKAIVQASFDAWAAGTGSPYDLLADNVTWTITGNSLASKTYGSREAFIERGHPALQCAHERRPEADHPPALRGRRHGHRLLRRERHGQGRHPLRQYLCLVPPHAGWQGHQGLGLLRQHRLQRFVDAGEAHAVSHSELVQRTWMKRNVRAHINAIS